MSVTGLAKGLMTLAGRTELLVEVQEDWHGWPSGRKLAGGTILLEQVGRRGWATLLFPGAAVLPSQPHWLLLKATAGHALWLAKPGTSAVHVLERSDSGSWSEKSALAGLEALYQIFQVFPREGQVRQRGATTLSLGGHIGATPSGEDDLKTFDLGSALSAYLADQPAGTTVVSVPLAFTSAVPGILTVYPPRVVYDV